jgi:integrase
VSLFKRGGVWWYDFQVRGVRVRESSGFASKADAVHSEALRKAGLIQSNGKLEVKIPETRFGEFALTEFASWSENELSEHPSTHQRYMRSVKVLVRYFGQRTFDMITSAEVERFKITRSHERRKFAADKRHVTPGAVNRDLAVLRILFNLAIRLNKARVNPVSGVKLLAEHNLQMRVVSPEEESAYLTAASQPLRDVATIILETGMRPGEVFRLRREDVNLELSFLRVPSGKTPFARRTIPLTRRDLTVLSRRVSSAKTTWIFPSRIDSSRPIGWLRKAHIKALRLAAINPPFRLYDLRHTALTRMAMAGIDLPTLRELAGHANIQMTMRYIHPTPDHKREAMRKLEQFTVGRSFAADERNRSAHRES